MEGIHYVVTRALTAPDSAPWVLFLHGIGGASFFFKAMTARFGRVFNTVCIDLPGRGQSTTFPDAPPGVDDYIQVIETVMSIVFHDSEAPLAPYGIVAHSMGGVLALSMARRLRSRVSFLVLLSPAGQMEEHWKVRLLRVLPGVFRRSLSRIVGSLFFMKHFDWPRDFEHRHSLAYRDYLASMERQYVTNPYFLHAMVNDGLHIPLSSSMSSPCPYEGPVLLLWGEHDVVVPLFPSLSRFQRLFPHATTGVIDQTRHAFFLEAPHTTWSCIESFLHEHGYAT